MNSILDIEVSRFLNYDTPGNPKMQNLLSWLQSAEYKKEVEQIRTQKDKAARDLLKALLPAITPSGIFTYRAIKYLVKHSGFMQFDIDFKGNERIGNFDKLQQHICNIPNVAYCGLSVSATGYWGLVPIAYPDKHKLQFIALEAAFKSFGITLDTSRKDVSGLRGYSYDPNGYFNHHATTFLKYHQPILQKTVQHSIRPSVTNGKPLEIAANMIRLANDGQKWEALRKASYLLGGHAANGTINDDEAVDFLKKEIEAKPNVQDIQAAFITIEKCFEAGKSEPIRQNYSPKNDSFKVRVNEQNPQALVQTKPKATTECVIKNEPSQSVQKLPVFVQDKPDLKSHEWDEQIAALQSFFKAATLPSSLKLNGHTTITNVSLFIQSHLSVVITNNGNRTFAPYLERLFQVMESLQ